MSNTRRLARLAAILGLLTILATGTFLWHQGYRVYVVHTGSMTPTYRPGDLVVDGAPGKLERGQVITFRHSAIATDVVTHRITDITPTGLIHTKGDANATADVWDIRPSQVQGRVHFALHGFGYVAVFLQQPAGIASLATTALSVVLLWGLFFPAEVGADDDPDASDDGANDLDDDHESVNEDARRTVADLVLALAYRPNSALSGGVAVVSQL